VAYFGGKHRKHLISCVCNFLNFDFWGFYAAAPPPPSLGARLKVSNVDTRVSGRGHLHTVALRPTLLYGEQDPRLVTSLIRLSEKMDGSLVRFAGPGGVQQFTYVGKTSDFT
jgi:hypothetical protein